MRVSGRPAAGRGGSRMSRGELSGTFHVAVVVLAQVDRDGGRAESEFLHGLKKDQNMSQNLQKSSHSPIEMQLCILDDTFLNNGVPYLPSLVPLADLACCSLVPIFSISSPRRRR